MIAKPTCPICSLARAMIFACLACVPLNGFAQSLISYDVATPVGLERSWFAQVQLNVSRHRMRSWLLFENNLLALTTGGLIHSFNADTGETLWTAQPGPLDQPATGPAASGKYVSVVSGGELYVLDRANGQLLWSRTLGSAAAAAPTLSEEYAYVSFLNGRVEGHRLDKRSALPWYSQSVGRIFHSPSTSGRVITWPTDRGYLYVGQASPPRVLYRIETTSPVTAPPTEADPYLYVASADGHVYCFDALDGDEVWRYSMGYTATGRAAVVGDRLYVASNEPMLHAVNAITGELLWTVPGITQFVAQGLKNAYGLDDLGKLVIIDVETGKYVGTLAGENYQAVFNEQSDRVFLVNDRGLVQCLHEIGAVEPTMYRKIPKIKEQLAEPAEAAATPFAEEPAEPTVPFGEEPADEEPADAFPTDEDEAEDNPFSFGE
jgi:outer membrane protein assembly factor BamB